MEWKTEFYIIFKKQNLTRIQFKAYCEKLEVSKILKNE